MIDRSLKHFRSRANAAHVRSYRDERYCGSVAIMVNWGQLDSEAPTLAREVRRVFQAAKSHVLATVRLDGSPRVSGIEVQFAGSELTIGSMAQSMKAMDLRRDPRFALHSSPAEGGDAKLAGRVVETAGPPDHDSHTFQLDLSMVVYTSIGTGSDHLLIQIWHPGQHVHSVRRY